MIIQGNAMQIPLADKSVQCVVTSPPYWGLRDYGTATWVGGDEGCDHRGIEPRTVSGGDGKQYTNAGSNRVYSGNCSCGATRIDSQIGLEKTPEEYVAKIVAVFSEVWRVLRDDGTCWVNLGDSYNNFRVEMGPGQAVHGRDNLNGKPAPKSRRRGAEGLKEKDLVGIPWRCAFALQAAGWYLRSDIIWSKPNPMPESVTDRPTKAHEYIFLLTKRERYYFDQDAVREAQCESTINHAPRKPRTLKGEDEFGLKPTFGAINEIEGGRNIRTVWQIATQPYPDAHFATFPEEIAVRCIKAGTSEKGACAECGAPWERVTETTRSKDPPRHTGCAAVGCDDRQDGDWPRMLTENKTTGWQPTCKHDAPTVACKVLDPFCGSGTVVQVAQDLGRIGIGVDMKMEYLKMAKRRSAQLGFGMCA